MNDLKDLGGRSNTKKLRQTVAVPFAFLSAPFLRVLLILFVFMPLSFVSISLIEPDRLVSS